MSARARNAIATAFGVFHDRARRTDVAASARAASTFDLGWRLAWTLNGWSAPGLLDDYEAERRPLVEQSVGRSADPNWTAPDFLNVGLGELGGRIPHTWLPGAAGRTSTVDLLGQGLTLFTGPSHRAWEGALAALDPRVPVRVRRLDAATARVLGVRDGGALLARPDGVPVAAWPPGTQARDALAGGLAIATHRSAEARPAALAA